MNQNFNALIQMKFFGCRKIHVSSAFQRGIGDPKLPKVSLRTPMYMCSLPGKPKRYLPLKKWGHFTASLFNIVLNTREGEKLI